MLGEVIHGYRVDRALSADKGGFGDVYFATHVESGAEAVVKVLKPEMSAHRDIVTRFFNEARAAASVHHPGIVQIHNVGYHRERAYLLMERLRGDDLETRLKAGPLPVDRAIVFLRQAAGAVGAAHDRGIVHRDLKPANLFVVADPDVVGGERVKVLDFGIAKLTADAAGSKTQGVFGTPAYMSPEQCASSGAVDVRADLYSLGCILYELVCGRPPFGHGGLELIAAHLRDTPPPPRAIAPWVPPAVEQLILRLLEKQPERRLPSCAALIAALDEVAAAAGIVVTNAPRMPSGQVATVPGNPQLQFATTSPEPRTAFAGPSEPGMYAPGAGVLQQAIPLASPNATSSTKRARRFGRWLWGVAVLGASVGTVIALLVPGGGENPSHRASGSAVATTRDAAVDAPAADATVVAIATPDAAVPDAATLAAVEVVVADAGPMGGARSQDAQSNDPCGSAHIDDLVTDAQNQFGAGQAKSALALLNRALACKQDVRLYRLAAMYACAARDLARAKLYIEEIPPTYRPAIEQRCQQEGLSLREASSSQTPSGGSADRPLSQAEIAARFNEEGKQLLYQENPEAAARKFQEAVARAPEAKYFVNLCVALLQQGRLGDAITACKAVAHQHPTAEQQAKADKLLERIREEARRQHVELP